MRATVPAILTVALFAAACQPTTPPTNIRTGEGMVDPATGILDRQYIDGTFLLSVLIEERLRQPLHNSDRREVDAALDAALSGAPIAPPVRWRNALRGNAGSVDLVSWRIDQRAGELCGVIQHEGRYDKPVSGAVTICRASIDPAWRIDEVIWDKPVAAVRPADPRPPYRPTYRPTRPADPRPPSQGGTPPVNYGPGSDPGPQPDPTAQNCQPQRGGGAMTLGDCLAQPAN